ncbi:MAG: hypothetical protein EXR95_11145 [Gemmatimonadetes bacterium]|nr:hypothetical protein [Gemmatimonadota bacterium]
MLPHSQLRHHPRRNRIGETAMTTRAVGRGPRPGPGSGPGSGLGSGLVRLSAALAARDPEALTARMRELAEPAEEVAVLDRADATAIEEALLQSYLFVGYPVTLNAIGLWREISGRPAPPASADDWDAWMQRGAEVCRMVYGGKYEELRENVRALHPDFERWMVAEGYGKVLGRPGLELVDRELCIVAMLAVLDTQRQLYSHLRGALHAGAAEADIERALTEASAFTDEMVTARARESWRRVRERHGTADVERDGADTSGA